MYFKVIPCGCVEEVLEVLPREVPGLLGGISLGCPDGLAAAAAGNLSCSAEAAEAVMASRYCGAPSSAALLSPSAECCSDLEAVPLRNWAVNP